jgi:hypothetical protein
LPYHTVMISYLMKINRRGGRIMAKMFFDKSSSNKPAMYGAAAGLGIYGTIFLIAPSVFHNLAIGIAQATSTVLGSTLGMTLGYILPLAAVLTTFAISAMLLMHALKAMLKNAASKYIPGGRGTVDALENMAEVGMAFVNCFKK